jgi:hypothetical protein
MPAIEVRRHLVRFVLQRIVHAADRQRRLR